MNFWGPGAMMDDDGFRARLNFGWSGLQKASSEGTGGLGRIREGVSASQFDAVSSGSCFCFAFRGVHSTLAIVTSETKGAENHAVSLYEAHTRRTNRKEHITARTEPLAMTSVSRKEPSSLTATRRLLSQDTQQLELLVAFASCM